MPESRNQMSRAFVLMLCVTALSFTISCMSSVSARRPASLLKLSAEQNPPQVGLRVLSVFDGSPARRVGLRNMDLISRYGDHEIVDAATYFTAREEYEKHPDSQVQVIFWRGREAMTVSVPPGKIGIEFNEYSATKYQFDSLMEAFNVKQSLPEYFRDNGSKISTSTLVADLEKAKSLIDRAEQEKSLTPSQILVARIYMITDTAEPGDIKKQKEYLQRLISTEPAGYIEYLGSDLFFANKRFRPAVECLEKALASDPSNASIRLNLGIAYDKVGMFDDADAAVEYILDHKLGLSEYGYGVACEVQALAALGRREFAKSMGYAQKAFEIHQNTFEMSMWQLAAAQNGDLKEFYEVSNQCKQILPKGYLELQERTDALEAFVLIKNNQRERAREIVRRWKPEGADSNPKYWKRFPSGLEVAQVLGDFVKG